MESSPELDDRLDRLITSVDSLEHELRDHRNELRSYKETLTKKVVRATIAVTIALTGLVFALIGDVVAVVVAVDSHNTADRVSQIVASSEIDRAQAREAACIQSNKTIEALRGAIPSALLAFVPNPEHLADGALLATLTPEQRKAFDGYAAKTAAQLQFRDCSTNGIAEYYRNPPRDPALPK